MLQNEKLKDMFLTIHMLFAFSILFSPFFISNSSKKKYGKYIALIQIITIISWCTSKMCPLGSIEGSSDKGALISFLNRILKIDTKNYDNFLLDLFTYTWFSVAYYYSNTIYKSKIKNKYVKLMILVLFIFCRYNNFFKCYKN
tara:strand:+ start:28 stop:456 length:429 start_codon:yes stop_codon:yes gene_type:complete